MTDAITEAKTPLILVQMQARLHEIFDNHIDLTDVGNRPEKDRESYFLTRAFLALFFLEQHGLSAAEAAACITDGGADDGIDGIYVDKPNARIYLAQSKWRTNMRKGVELGDFTRFRDGIRNVIKGEWTAGNADLHRFRPDLEQQLTNIDTEVITVLAHTSEQEIAENIREKIDQFLREENRYSEFVSFREFPIKQAARVARSHTRPENIDVTLMLAHWGMVSAPYHAVYGSIAAAELVECYKLNGNKLFAENLRFGIEKSEVNDGIITTAESAPEHFWYFNNGVTAICDSVTKQKMGGNDTSSGVFDVKKISVINGAQTISSLSKATKNQSLNDIRVQIRIISLKDTPDEFASLVTSANNTQNDLNPVDFVAGDPHQDRLRKEANGLGLNYTFRRGDKEPDRQQGFTVRAATIALACASGDLRLAVSAKRYISGLWENTRREPYTRLFNAETRASYVWNVVQVMNAVDDELTVAAGELNGRERLTAVHANRFILHRVFKKVIVTGDDRGDQLDAKLNEARKIAAETLGHLNEAIATNLPDAYPGNIFKNQERQAELLKILDEADEAKLGGVFS